MLHRIFHPCVVTGRELSSEEEDMLQQGFSIAQPLPVVLAPVALSLWPSRSVVPPLAPFSVMEALAEVFHRSISILF
jgi:hypothetical protein